jgi:hypothetical protein
MGYYFLESNINYFIIIYYNKSINNILFIYFIKLLILTMIKEIKILKK